MSKPKKTQTPSAMKPEKVKAAVDQTNADTAQANEANKAAETQGATEGSEGAPAVNDTTGQKLPESEQSPTPAERQAEAGTKTQAEQKKAQDSAAGQKNKVDQVEEGEGEEVQKKTLKDRDLSNSEDVGELVEEILEGIVSLGHPLAGALNGKPKVGQVWDEIVQKAKAVKGAIEEQKARSKK